MNAVTEQGYVAAPVSLYLALGKGKAADIEAVARASLAWAETIKEMAFIVDPSLEIRVELVSGTEGSLSLNSLIRSVKNTVSDPRKLKAIAIAVLIYFGQQIRDYSVEGVLDWFTKEDVPASIKKISDEERKLLAAEIAKALKADVGREKGRVVYRELQRDPAVEGVGISLTPETPPTVIVPRTDFAARAGEEGVTEEVIRRRTETHRETVVLLSPMLTDGDQKWKFQLGSKNFWAVMGDARFKALLQPGSNQAPRMIAGLRMDVDIVTIQEHRDGVWVNTSHRIEKVHGIQEPQKQASWLDAPAEENES